MASTLRYIACLALIISSTVISAAELTEIIAYPSDIGLYNARDRQIITVQAVFADGLTRDVTAEATITVADKNLIKLEGTTLAPAADGETTVSVTFGGKTLSLPAVVKDSTVTPELSFKLDIMPIFMKANCNTGSCHGAASGKDGFRLSLFGFDHAGDYQRVTREIGNRRINLAFPHESLMLTKSTAAVPHTGGTRFRKDDPLYNLMHEWIDAGAVADKADIPTCTKIEVYPRSAVLDGEGATQKITVRAFYSDGTNRDVSHLAFFLSSNENSVIIDQDGTTTAQNRG
ncbi:MAG: cell surface protein, partial [Planctomycetaceae bacterium]|nr:cell surface protein [Planctomycetaceae bacterium]